MKHFTPWPMLSLTLHPLTSTLPAIEGIWRCWALLQLNNGPALLTSLDTIDEDALRMLC